MSLTKIVDGVSVECLPEEEAQILAEWATNDPAKLPQLAPLPTLVNQILASPADLAALKKALGL